MLQLRVALLGVATAILLALLVGALVRRRDRPGWPTISGLVISAAITAWATCTSALLL